MNINHENSISEALRSFLLSIAVMNGCGRREESVRCAPCVHVRECAFICIYTRRGEQVHSTQRTQQNQFSLSALEN